MKKKVADGSKNFPDSDYADRICMYGKAKSLILPVLPINWSS